MCFFNFLFFCIYFNFNFLVFLIISSFQNEIIQYKRIYQNDKEIVKVNKEIQITPIIQSLLSYKIIPELPIGLFISQNGEIYGKPKMQMENTRYAIYFTNSENSNNFVSYIEIKIENEIKDCFYLFSELYRLPIEKTTFKCYCDYKIDEFKLESNYLTDYITVDKENGDLTISPFEYNEDIKLNIIASNFEVSLEIPLIIHPVNNINRNGVKYHYYGTQYYNCSVNPTFSQELEGFYLSDSFIGYEKNWIFDEIIKGNRYGDNKVYFTSNITIEESGEYTFYLEIKDGGILSIDGNKVIDLDNVCSKEIVAKEEKINLEEGDHSIEIYTIETELRNECYLNVQYKLPNGDKKIPIPMKFCIS